MQIMIDLETLGTASDAAIISIGAVKFDHKLAGDPILDAFHVHIHPASALQYKLSVSGDTLMWWLHPDRDQARKELVESQAVDLPSAIEGFAMWYGAESLPTWGNGAAFDNVILRTAYEKLGMETPWKFWDDRCYRTMKNLMPEIKMGRAGTHHNALDDAEHQARHLCKILTSLDAYV